MVQQLINSLDILRHALKLAWRRPVVLLPLFVLWILYVPLVAYLAFHADVTVIPPFLASLLLFLAPIALHFGLVLTAAMLAVITRNLEAGKSADVAAALKRVLDDHKYKLLGLGVVAGAINMLLIMFQAVNAPDTGGIPDELRVFTIEHLARILLNIGSEEVLNVEALKFAMIKKAVRLTIFLAVPGFVLARGASQRSLFDPAFYAIDRNMLVAIGGLVLTTFVVFVLSLPAAHVIRANDMGVLALSDTGWYLMMAYAGFLWIVMLFMEQVYCLLLFRWQDDREARGPKAGLNDAPMPDLGAVRQKADATNDADKS